MSLQSGISRIEGNSETKILNQVNPSTSYAPRFLRGSFISRFAILVQKLLCDAAESLEVRLKVLESIEQMFFNLRDWASQLLFFVQESKMKIERVSLENLSFNSPSNEELTSSKVLFNALLAIVVLKMIKFCWLELKPNNLTRMPIISYL